MADALHLYAVARGTYTDSLLSAETWQFGIRFAVTDEAPAPLGDLEPFAVAARADSRPMTNGQGVSNWLGERGPAGDLDPLDFLDDQFYPFLQSFYTNNGARLSSSCVINQLRAYPIGNDGTAVEERSATLTLTTPLAGNGTNSLLPPQNALVFSFGTQRLGSSGRGRVYVPGLTELGTINGCLSTAHQSSLLTGFKNGLLLSKVSTTDLKVNPAVIGRGPTGSVVPPWSTYALIDSIRLGRVIDVQRRRRRQIPENYTKVAFS